jgi:hypothetical protein
MSTVSAETAARLVARWNSHIGATNMDDVEESLNDR